MGTTAVATTAITRGEVHGSTTTARAMSLHAQREPNALPNRAQASHSRASRAEQPTPVVQPALDEQPTPVAQLAPEQPTLVAQPAPDEQPTPVAQLAPEQPTLVALPAPEEQPTPVVQPAPDEQPTPVAQLAPEQPTLVAQPTSVALPAPEEQPTPVVQPAPDEQPTPVAQLAPEQPTLVAQPAPTKQPIPVVSQAAQVGPRSSQPLGPIIEGPIIEPGAFSPHISADLTFPNSNLAHGVYHPSTAQGGTFLPSSSNPNGEQHLARQVIELTSALAQQTTLVNQLLQRTKMQRAPNEVSRSRTREDEEPLQ